MSAPLAVVLSTLLAGAPQEGAAGAAGADQAAPPVEAEAAGASTQAGADARDHQAQLDAFNARLTELDGKIVLAKEKVDLLRDTMLGGAIAKSRAVIVHRNEMGSSFVLDKAVYLLDGGVIFSRENTDGALDEIKELEIFNGPISPGPHELQVSLVYSGSSRGLFTYLKGYKFKIDSKRPYAFVVPDGRLATLSVVSFAKGDITTSTTDRIAVRYDLEVGNVPADGSAGAPAGGGSSAGETPPVGAEKPAGSP